ncbi:hypothetical protein BU14_1549s0002 [Porphyra umbilicalis]|uniref:Protein-serine/threonine kinase n=1 Tax=Porphyra umbilicalis TaxID=2786 RepID=A0A1X6NL83_PORUM|nr:hypothetical protein BU14_1549s0002 [Porphyra umbilicalis]|eukprot:OSX69401.1 hypothetical protein BU14_1549s0002 [Porphyra umbilicalis]
MLSTSAARAIVAARVRSVSTASGGGARAAASAAAAAAVRRRSGAAARRAESPPPPTASRQGAARSAASVATTGSGSRRGGAGGASPAGPLTAAARQQQRGRSASAAAATRASAMRSAASTKDGSTSPKSPRGRSSRWDTSSASSSSMGPGAPSPASCPVTRTAVNSGGLTAALSEQLQQYARLEQTPLTLKNLYEFASSRVPGHELLSAQWLYCELPVRLARRVLELENLPYRLCSMPSVIKVREMYAQSFLDLVSEPRPTEEADVARLNNVIGMVRTRHDDVVRLIAQGIIELKAECGVSADDRLVTSFLDRFYSSRIGIRVLISHQLAMAAPKPGFAGIINTSCQPAVVAADAAEAVRQIAYHNLGEAPDIDILGNTDLSLPYLDGHMFLIMFELLKNSVRATVESHADSPVLPPVKMIIADGAEDVTIKLSDEGGGMRRSDVDRVFDYFFTTAAVPAETLFRMEDDYAAKGASRPEVLAGFGYGLPLSRAYARFFGGELTLMSMDGWGTDTYLHLNKLGNKEEVLPD